MGLRTCTQRRLLTLLMLFLGGVGCSARSDYQKARDLDTPEAYEAFLEEHPNDQEYSRQAERHLARLAFEEASKQDTFSAYTRFLRRYPYSPYAARAQQAAEALRAEELGISLYRRQPADFYEWVRDRYLPYRILFRSSSPDPAGTRHTERKWYLEILRRGLFIPMDPHETYRISPDMTVYLRESVVNLCARALALVEAEVRVRGDTVKTYRIAADHIEQYLLYEIFKDRHLYDPLFRTPQEEIRAVERRFERKRKELPLEGSLALEFEITQQASEHDQEMIREFVGFLRGLSLFEDFQAYSRGRPSDRVVSRRLYLWVNQETHAPEASRRWRSTGSSVDWGAWNTKWILEDRVYFFKKMTLDLLDLLSARADRGSGS